MLLPTNGLAYFPEQVTLPPVEVPAPQPEDLLPILPPPLPAVRLIAYTWNGQETITRSTFVAGIVRRLYKPSERCFPKLSASDYSLLAKDVPKDAPYGADLCTAMRSGIMKGFTDGGFHPDANVTVQEAAKVLAKAFSLAVDPTDPTQPWSENYVKALTSAGVLSPEANLNAPITRKELSEMLWKLRDMAKEAK
jgi:hypothetical protein